MTRTDHSGPDRPGRPTPESRGQPSALEEPTASRVTLARRLRAVERALGEAPEAETGPGSERVAPGDIDAMSARLDALCRAVEVIGEHLVARDRARRTDDGIEPVRRAVEALADAGDGTDTAARDDCDAADTGRDGEVEVDFGTLDPKTSSDCEAASDPEESPTEWLDRVAAGGVAPPSTE